MTTHAAYTAQLFERIEAWEEEQRRLRAESEEIASKLERAKLEADLHLLLADVAGVLRDVDTRNLSEGKRVRLQGVRKRVLSHLGATG